MQGRPSEVTRYGEHCHRRQSAKHRRQRRTAVEDPNASSGNRSRRVLAARRGWLATSSGGRRPIRGERGERCERGTPSASPARAGHLPTITRRPLETVSFRTVPRGVDQYPRAMSELIGAPSDCPGWVSRFERPNMKRNATTDERLSGMTGDVRSHIDQHSQSCPRCQRLNASEAEDQSGSSARWFACDHCGMRYTAARPAQNGRHG